MPRITGAGQSFGPRTFRKTICKLRGRKATYAKRVQKVCHKTDNPKRNEATLLLKIFSVLKQINAKNDRIDNQVNTRNHLDN